MMKKNHYDADLYEILHFSPEISSEVQDKIDTAYERIRNDTAKRKSDIYVKKRFFHKALPLGFAAAVILMTAFLGFSNPALAGKIPFIGRIFRLVETDIGYQGNYSEHSVPIDTADTVSDDAGQEDSSQTAGDVTITFSEASYTEMALYFSLEIYSEEGFPEDFNKVKNMEDYILSYDFLYERGRQTFDFSQADSSQYAAAVSHGVADSVAPPYLIEGNYIDSHTFLGVIRVDLEDVRRILDIDALPPEFDYSLTIEHFWGELFETKDIIATSESGESMVIPEPIRKYYEGPWSFSTRVSMSDTKSQTKEIMETNEDGIGISTVIKTPYEIKADIILPENADWFDYIVVITDADGKILDSQGNNAEIYSVYGRNTDTIYIYVVDYLTYMDECKAENAYLLPEKALYQTKIEW